MASVDGRDTLLGISWHDSAWIPVLNPANVLDYFSERSNPFYDRTCNNEVVKMQRLSLEQLNNMTGLEYILLHTQEPILYIVRKQHRHSPTQVTPFADFYIIAGVVYQAPDLGTVINSRILSAVHNIQSAFDETQAYSRYHPSKGYWWRFKDQDFKEKSKPKDKKDEPSSYFQRQRVDMLLSELCQKFPPKYYQPKPGEKPLAAEQVKKESEPVAESAVKSEDKESAKGGGTQSGAATKPPAEKRSRLA
ncbi:mediator of RNA polymerase II transcription subunit 6 [Lethenteron reissneri]|uniref:mediator of RNA polymerase II transcription subunit 6 n=1 Tax=Lethenteron reissneri TaxID=7753 RepID=UPI002AB726DC|nr:mediator of RNA polymerase II transcription subunit 6 [Lethenteron reissneri]